MDVEVDEDEGDPSLPFIWRFISTLTPSLSLDKDSLFCAIWRKFVYRFSTAPPLGNIPYLWCEFVFRAVISLVALGLDALLLLLVLALRAVTEITLCAKSWNAIKRDRRRHLEWWLLVVGAIIVLCFLLGATFYDVLWVALLGALGKNAECLNLSCQRWWRLYLYMYKYWWWAGEWWMSGWAVENAFYFWDGENRKRDDDSVGMCGRQAGFPRN